MSDKQNIRYSKSKPSKKNESAKSLFRQDSELFEENFHDCHDNKEDKKKSETIDTRSVIHDELIRFCLNELQKLECKVSKQNHHIRKIESDLISLPLAVIITDDESSDDDIDECKVSIQKHHIKAMKSDLTSVPTINIITDDESSERDVDAVELFHIPKTFNYLKSRGFLPPKNLISFGTNVKLCSNNDLILKIAFYKIIGDLIILGISQLLK